MYENQNSGLTINVIMFDLPISERSQTMFDHVGWESLGPPTDGEIILCSFVDREK